MYFQASLLVSLSEVVFWCIRTTHSALTEEMRRKPHKKSNHESLHALQKVFFESQILQGPQAN